MFFQSAMDRRALRCRAVLAISVFKNHKTFADTHLRQFGCAHGFRFFLLGFLVHGESLLAIR
jgi:hypothetical protein